MTLGELFIKIGFKPDTDGLKNVQANVQRAAAGIQSKVGAFKQAGTAISSGLKSIGSGITGFFSGINSGANKIGDFIANIKAIHIQIIAVAAAFTMITKKASDYAAELLRVNSVTGISTRALQELQQQAALSGVEADEVNSALKGIQQQALDIQMGGGNLRAWSMLGINPNEDPIKVLNQLKGALKGMSPAMGAKWANELGLSDKMISFLKEAGSLGASDKSLLLSEKEIKKLKEFNIFFNRAWDSSKRMLQKLGVSMMPVATAIISAFEKMAKTGRDIGRFIEWFGEKFPTITKSLLAFAVIIGVALFPITAGFLALGLAINDVMVWFSGGKSITGEIIGPFKEWRGVIDDIIARLMMMESVLKDLTSLAGWKSIAQYLEIGAKEALGIAGYNTAPAGAGGKVGGENKLNDMYDSIKGFFTATPKNDVTVNVNGAGDPAEVAKKVVDGINSNTMYQQPVGVK